MCLGIAGVDFQGLVKNFNTPDVMPQIAQGAAGVAQDLGASVIKRDRLVVVRPDILVFRALTTHVGNFGTSEFELQF